MANFILKNKNKVKGWTKEPANFLLMRMLVHFKSSKGQHSWLEIVPGEASLLIWIFHSLSAHIVKTQSQRKFLVRLMAIDPKYCCPIYSVTPPLVHFKWLRIYFLRNNYDVMHCEWCKKSCEFMCK